MTTTLAETRTGDNAGIGAFSGVRILTPGKCDMFKGLHSLLHVQLHDDSDEIGLSGLSMLYGHSPCRLRMNTSS